MNAALMKDGRGNANNVDEDEGRTTDGQRLSEDVDLPN